MDRGAWQGIVHGVAKSQIRLKRLSMHTCICVCVSQVQVQVQVKVSVYMYVQMLIQACPSVQEQCLATDKITSLFLLT